MSSETAEDDDASAAASSLSQDAGFESGGNVDGSDNSDIYLSAPHHRQSQQQQSSSFLLAGQLKRNAFLEGELEKLLDDIDNYEQKLDDAEEEIESLLFQKKKLQLTLDNVGFRRTEFEALKQELDESRDKIVNQQQLLDEQELQIEEQDQVIQGFEEEFKEKNVSIDKTRQQRISDGRKSMYEIATAKKEMQIAMLQAELDEWKNGPSPKNNGNGGGASFSELQTALARIDALEREKEETNATIAVLKDSVKELQEKLKKSSNQNKDLQDKISTASEKSHDWKRRAETAEKQLSARMNNINNSFSVIGEGTDSEEEEGAGGVKRGSDAPQALLLQSALAKKQETSNSNGWGLGAVFGNRGNNNKNKNSSKDNKDKKNNNDTGNKLSASAVNIFNQSAAGGLFSSKQTLPSMGTSTTSILTSDGGGGAGGSTAMNSMYHMNGQAHLSDDSDLECIKQINRSLKDANKQLRKDLEKLEKAHKKEQAFNQKLIVKLQKENEKLNKKLGSAKALSGGGGSSSLEMIDKDNNNNNNNNKDNTNNNNVTKKEHRKGRRSSTKALRSSILGQK